MFAFFPRWRWTATRFRRATITTAAKKDMAKRSARTPRISPHPRDDEAEVCPHQRVGASSSPFSHHGLPGVPRREARVALHRLGHTHRNIRGWKAPCYLMTDRALSSLPGDARQGRLEQIRRCRRRRPHPRCEKLHGPLRLRPERGAGRGQPPGDNVPDDQIQFRPPASPLQGRRQSGCLQRHSAGKDTSPRPGRRSSPPRGRKVPYRNHGTHVEPAQVTLCHPARRGGRAGGRRNQAL